MKLGTKLRVSAIIFKKDEILVTKHDAKGYGIYYLLPGGGIEHSESPEEALKREVKEECSLDVDIGRLVYYKTGYSDNDDYLDLIFLCKIIGEKIKISKGEDKVKEVKFVNKKELEKLRFFPRQIVDLVFEKLSEETEYLGKFKYPET